MPFVLLLRFVVEFEQGQVAARERVAEQEQERELRIERALPWVLQPSLQRVRARLSCSLR